MNCPACNASMTTEDFDGISVDICRDGCKGMWLDWMELRRLEDKNLALNAAMQEAFAWPEKSNPGLGQLNCPKCHEPLHRHQAELDPQVTLDECYDCGGFFLESGELKDIRDHEMTPEQEEAYADKLANGLPEWRQAQSDLKRDEARTDAIAHFTRFMRLSYYMTGK